VYRVLYKETDPKQLIMWRPELPVFTVWHASEDQTKALAAK